VLAHNAPAHAANRLAPDSLAHLAADGVIAGVVERDADLGMLAATLLPVAGDAALFADLDGKLYPALRAGARGILSPVAGVAPRQVVAIYDAHRSGDHGRAEASQGRIDALARTVAHESGPAAPCKEALALLGLPAGPVRRPLPDLAARERDAIRAALTGLGLL
jgi:4-hydroxy-tetrahydrodipicolinate synthase